MLVALDGRQGTLDELAARAQDALDQAFADGSVRTVSRNIDMNFAMPALGSIGNGETIQGDF